MLAYKLIYNSMLFEGQHQLLLTHTKNLGNVQFLSFLKSQTDTAPIIFSIQKYLEHHPAFYLSSILSFLKGRDLNFIKQYITKESEQLLNGSSFLHRMNANIEGRKKCINKIKRDITRASKIVNLFQKEYASDREEDGDYYEWVELEGYSAVDVDESIEDSIKLLRSIFMDMSRLRDMTIYIVENIHAWRLSIQEHSDRCQQYSPIHYFHQNAEVYQTILQDTSFIWSSKLAGYIWMQAKQDPFIIRNVIHVEQRESKTPLEKYFVQSLYPQTQIVIEKCLKCFQMLLFKYKLKLTNRFQQQQMLIENYLKLQLKNHEFEEQSNVSRSQKLKESVVKSQKNNNPAQPTSNREGHNKNKLNIRGWVFDKNMSLKNRERINKIIDNHKLKSNIKPFNISNYAEKNSIALAYLSQAQNKHHSKSPNRIHQNNFFSQEEGVQQARKSEMESEGERERKLKTSESRMFKSLTKLNPIILEDPKQQLPQTPKHKNPPANSPKPSFNSLIKLNSYPNPQQQEKIQVDHQQTPLNMKQFFQIFRANTDKPKKKQAQQQKQIHSQKLIAIKQLLHRSRKIRGKSLHSKNTFLGQKVKKQRQKELSKDKSYNSYKQLQTNNNKEIHEKKPSNILIILKIKSVPEDLVVSYVKHITSQQHYSSHSFTNFKTEDILKKLLDPFIHCLIFDIFTEDQQHLGQVVLSQSITRRSKLKYIAQFIYVNTFQFLPAAILRISEQLLATSPCQEVVFPFVVDQMDLVSTHFMQLIDAGLREGVDKFGKMSLLQKIKSSNQGSDIRERLYVFSSVRQKSDGVMQMLGNYRCIKFQVKCLVMCSNFRLRYKKAIDKIQKYGQESLGQLYVRIMSKILTRYHLKQLRAASFGDDQLGQLLRTDMFARNIFYDLIEALEGNNNNQLLKLTAFENMSDLLNYLRYKRHDSHFQFDFLKQSRFILHHELLLAQLDEEVSLDFSLTSNKQIYIMANHKQQAIVKLMSQTLTTPIYLVATANQKIKVFFMTAQEYLNTHLDLFSYLHHFFHHKYSEKNLHQVPAIVIPNLSTKAKVTPVRMFDTFFKLFPERQFYTASSINCVNHWENYYSNAVIHMPKENSIILDFPLVVGLYDVRTRYPLAAFLYSQDQPL